MTPTPPPPPPVQNTATGFTDKNMQAHIFRTEAEKTRNFIWAIAGVYFAGGLVSAIIVGAFAGVIIVSILLFPIIFAGVGFIAPKQPFTAIIIAAIVVVLILIILVAVGGGSWIGWLYFLIAVGCIVGGYMSATKAEQARKLMH